MWFKQVILDEPNEIGSVCTEATMEWFDSPRPISNMLVKAEETKADKQSIKKWIHLDG